MITADTQLALAFHDTDNRLRACGSHAEVQFLFGLVRAGWLQVPPANDNAGIGNEPMWQHPRYPQTVLFQQFEIEPYFSIRRRVDFCFRGVTDEGHLIVEIDGVKWHSSGEQMVKDRRVDRATVLGGNGRWATLRYLASEVLDPRAADLAVAQVHMYLDFWKPILARAG